MESKAEKHIDCELFLTILASLEGIDTASMGVLQRPSLVKTLTTFKGYKILVLAYEPLQDYDLETRINKAISSLLLPAITDKTYSYMDILLRFS